MGQPSEAEEKVLKILEKAEVDFVVLARFMKILSPNFVWRFKKQDHQHSSVAATPVFRGRNRIGRHTSTA